LGWGIVVAKLLRWKLRRCPHFHHSSVHRAATDAELRRAALAAPCIPALKDGVFRAIRINRDRLQACRFRGGPIQRQQLQAGVKIPRERSPRLLPSEACLRRTMDDLVVKMWVGQRQRAQRDPDLTHGHIVRTAIKGKDFCLRRIERGKAELPRQLQDLVRIDGTLRCGLALCWNGCGKEQSRDQGFHRTPHCLLGRFERD
jgi:hypothetical protein